MDLLLVLSYAALCIAIFKIFKIPLTKWTVPTAILGGILLIGALIFTMNYNHPFSEMSRQYFVTTPIVPNVSGQVVEVVAKPNVLLKKGDLIFTIDDRSFVAKVKSLNARLIAAKDDMKRQQKLVKKGVGARRDLDQARALVDELKGNMQSARLDLENTKYRAPTDGYLSQLTLRPGVMAASLPLRPVGIFVHDESRYFTGWFWQNSMQRLKVGDEAEVIFDGIPGVVFQAEVDRVLPVIAQGQVQPSGTLIDQTTARVGGRLPVVLRITDPRLDEYTVIGGAYGQSAIYTEHFHHVAVMRKILLRN